MEQRGNSRTIDLRRHLRMYYISSLTRSSPQARRVNQYLWVNRAPGLCERNTWQNQMFD